MVDNMAYKLAKYLRNAGFDAEFQYEKNHENLLACAKAEKRIILTTDKRFFEKQEGWPVYFLKFGETSEQFQDIIQYFKLEVSDNKMLSRCVKCNNADLLTLDRDSVRSELKWKNETDYDLYDYYLQCKKCKQVYWEGTTWKNAKKHFQQFVKKEEEEQKIEEKEKEKEIEKVIEEVIEEVLKQKIDKIEIVEEKDVKDGNDMQKNTLLFE